MPVEGYGRLVVVCVAGDGFGLDIEGVVLKGVGVGHGRGVEEAIWVGVGVGVLVHAAGLRRAASRRGHCPWGRGDICAPLA